MGGPSLLDIVGFGAQGWGRQFAIGTGVTLAISLGAYAVGILFGSAGCAARLSAAPLLRRLASAYTTVIRAVPELLLIILLFYSGSAALDGLLAAVGLAGRADISGFAAAVLTLGFVQGAYMTEVLRGAIGAVPPGCVEAARALGLRRPHTVRLIVLPLMLRAALPGMGNLWQSVLKESALVSVVGFSELLTVGRNAASETKQYLGVLCFTALIYLLLTLASGLGFTAAEHQLERGVPLSMSFDEIMEMIPPLWDGLQVTLALWFLSGLLGLALAVPVAVARVSPRRGPSLLARGFITVVRGTPLLLQIYIAYFGLGTMLARFPALRHSLLWPFLREGFWYAVAALAISTAAYAGEILRGGINAVPRGEIEAGRSLGLRPWLVWRLLILPRALRICLPALAGQMINLMKSTALASTITVMDLLGTANYIRMQSFRVYEPLLSVALVYVVLTVLLLQLVARLEGRRPQEALPTEIAA